MKIVRIKRNYKYHKKTVANAVQTDLGKRTHAYDKTRKSYFTTYKFEFDTGSHIRIMCTNWSNKYEKDWWDNLKVEFTSSRMNKILSEPIFIEILTHIFHCEKILSFMKYLAIIFLVFSFYSWTKADDIRDFQIEGMSIGDSLLNFYTEEEIKSKIFLIIPIAMNSKDFIPKITIFYSMKVFK